MDLPERKLHRLKNYDYGNGYFFVTICTNDKKKLLCDIVGNDALVVPSTYQIIVTHSTIVTDGI